MSRTISTTPGIQFVGDFNLFAISNKSSSFRPSLEESSAQLPGLPKPPFGAPEVPETATWVLAIGLSCEKK
jgi:hypothetical protein